MDARKYCGTNFITLADVAEGPMQITIAEAREGRYGKIEIISEEGLVFSLNTGNTRKMVKAYGGKTEGWIGKTVELFSGVTEYQGKPQPSVLINPISAPIAPVPGQTATGATAIKSDMNDDIPFGASFL